MDHSFLLGLIGTILGVVSLTWQVAAWKMSGARLSVCFVWGIPIKSVKFGSMDEHLGIKVTNRGREAYSWGVGEDESGDGLYCGFEGVVRAAVIGV